MCGMALRRGLARGAISFQFRTAIKKLRTEVAGAELVGFDDKPGLPGPATRI
jgi:hypothetical protein